VKKVNAEKQEVEKRKKATMWYIRADNIKRRAAELYPDKSSAIQSLYDDEIMNVIECFKEGKIINFDFYVSKGLVKKAGRGKIKPGSMGKIILDAYDDLIKNPVRGDVVAQ
jgi:hypothetical protein